MDNNCGAKLPIESYEASGCHVHEGSYKRVSIIEVHPEHKLRIIYEDGSYAWGTALMVIPQGAVCDLNPSACYTIPVKWETKNENDNG